MMIYTFYVLAVVAIFASFRVISNHNPVHALLNMIVSLLAVAGIFFMLGAPFAGALEIIVYAGAILVLFVFVVMMLNLGGQTVAKESAWLSSQTWAIPTGLAFIIGIAMLFLISQAGGQPINGQSVTAKQVGTVLFTQYVVVVEIAAFLLLAALVAAYHLGKKALTDDMFAQPTENLSDNKASTGGEEKAR